MPKIIFTLFISVLLSFTVCREEKIISGLNALKKLYLNDTEYPKGFESQIKTLNLKSNIVVKLITNKTDPGFLIKLGVEEKIAKELIEDAGDMESNDYNSTNISVNSEKHPHYVNYTGVMVKSANLDHPNQYLAAASFDIKPEFVPQFITIKKCRKIFGVTKCKNVQIRKPFALTQDLYNVLLIGTRVELSRLILQEIDKMIEFLN